MGPCIGTLARLVDGMWEEVSAVRSKPRQFPRQRKRPSGSRLLARLGPEPGHLRLDPEG